VPLTHVGGRDQVKRSGRNLRFRLRFECRPGDDDPDGMSCFVGRLTVEEAIALVSLSGRVADEGDAVRYTVAGVLIKAGFRVEHTPGPIAEHVSVKWPGEWDDNAADAFDGSFVEYSTKEGSDG